MKNGVRQSMPFLQAVTELLESVTFVFCGPNGVGKTPLCRSLARTYAKARFMTQFAQSSTADSLRMLSVHGLFKPHMAVVLDEWRIGQDSQDQQAHKVDFLKCLTDVENPSAVRLRYSDVKFAPFMPRLISSQQTMQDWINVLQEAPETDRHAILKRVVFVHVNKPLVPPDVVKTMQDFKQVSLRAAFEAVGFVAPVPKGQLKSAGWT